MKKVIIVLFGFFSVFASVFSAGADLEDCGKALSKKTLSSPGCSTVTVSPVSYDSDSSDSTDSDNSDTEEIDAFEVLEIFYGHIVYLSQNIRAGLQQGLLLDGNAIYKKCIFTEQTLNALYRDLESQPLEREWVERFRDAFNHIYRVLRYPQLMRERNELCEMCRYNEEHVVCKECKKANKKAADKAYETSNSLIYWENKLATTFQQIKESHWLKEYVKTKKKSCFGRLL